MKILVTGAKGFVGKNICLFLRNAGFNDVIEVDLDTPIEVLDSAVKDCDFVLHFAGVNRPKNESEFIEGNYGFTSELLNKLKASNNKSPVLITSSIQATLDNPYGKSKKAAEDYMFAYSKETGANVYVYRLPNVFGKWCRPNYNSAVATFCNNIANNLPITVNDPSVELTLVYIDDIAEEIFRAISENPTRSDGNIIAKDFCIVPTTHKIQLGKIVELLYSFKESRENLTIPKMPKGSFESKLYSTYLSYLPKNNFSYPLNMNVDERGSFTEFLKTSDCGQVSVNITKPSVTKGNHWHHSKNEKFLVVKGNAVIRFRKVGDDRVIEYKVSGEKLEVVDIPTGYTHNIENIGNDDLVTVMWANEPFNPQKPDTFFEKV